MRPMRIFVNDDRHVMAKHSAVYPTQEELEAVQNMVSHTERALKAVSDWIDEQEKVSGEQPETESMETAAEEESKEGGDQKATEQLTRTLRGVMRVGLVAKGLLLKGDLDLELVLLCKDKPTAKLLEKVADNLGVQLAAITEDKYEIIQSVGDAAIIIKNTKEPPLSLTIHLTSPVVREELEKQLAGETLSVTDSPDVLDRQKCLAALASLRHAKWFQARANGLKSCVIVIRVLRDLCTRVPTWAPLRGWPLELLCEKSIGTANRPMGAGEALRRVLECLASGIVMPARPAARCLRPAPQGPGHGSPALQNAQETKEREPSRLYCSDPAQHHVRRHPHEAADGGGRGGEIPQQKEKEDSEKRGKAGASPGHERADEAEPAQARAPVQTGVPDRPRARSHLHHVRGDRRQHLRGLGALQENGQAARGCEGAAGHGVAHRGGGQGLRQGRRVGGGDGDQAGGGGSSARGGNGGNAHGSLAPLGSDPREREAAGTNPDEAREEPGDGAEREAARAQVRADLRDGRQPRQALCHGGGGGRAEVPRCWLKQEGGQSLRGAGRAGEAVPRCSRCHRAEQEEKSPRSSQGWPQIPSQTAQPGLRDGGGPHAQRGPPTPQHAGPRPGRKHPGPGQRPGRLRGQPRRLHEHRGWVRELRLRREFCHCWLQPVLQQRRPLQLGRRRRRRLLGLRLLLPGRGRLHGPRAAQARRQEAAARRRRRRRPKGLVRLRLRHPPGPAALRAGPVRRLRPRAGQAEGLRPRPGRLLLLQLLQLARRRLRLQLREQIQLQRQQRPRRRRQQLLRGRLLQLGLPRGLRGLRRRGLLVPRRILLPVQLQLPGFPELQRPPQLLPGVAGRIRQERAQHELPVQINPPVAPPRCPRARSPRGFIPFSPPSPRCSV
ncbi:interleukin enhancer-binding factor 3 isoform X2 [Agelaius tricolor]|uniref:interleukin enhancer-binding factor 3 isoform X2 n=1 Tax=Agelaius tricolor TaxID=9191 RepID=UPI0039F1EC06